MPSDTTWQWDGDGDGDGMGMGMGWGWGWDGDGDGMEMGMGWRWGWYGDGADGGHYFYISFVHTTTMVKSSSGFAPIGMAAFAAVAVAGAVYAARWWYLEYLKV